MARVDVRDRLIVALDLPTWDEAQRLVAQLDGLVSFFKVGLELYTASGRAAVEALSGTGKQIFLDLKLFDVPETVKRATRAAAAQRVRFLTVHEGGATVAAAVEGAQGSSLEVLAVTVLTSMDAQDMREMGCSLPLPELVLHRARRAQAAGAAGVIASPEEVAAIKRATGGKLLVITPGIRPAGAAAGDQKRLATPAAAIAAGADYLVVGRPIKAAPDPRAAAAAILEEMQAAFDRG
ncbi:MAG TPA: orotidine-5'-phosphate decarboxylase [Terriglobales bacterium]|nr:orotidine-5'-phosphate decarboxylase [Terriglobales bacterium]